MAEHDTLTREKILEAALDVLRRFGPNKANVVDVARALGVSHGSVYRHFASKVALRDAVVGRWLEGVSRPLAAIAEADGPAEARLKQWLDALIATKRAKRASADFELFETYRSVFDETAGVVEAHVAGLAEQVATILADGVRRGEFDVEDPVRTGRAVLEATSRFHNPAHAAEWSHPDIDRAFEAIWHLLLNGLRRRNGARGG